MRKFVHPNPFEIGELYTAMETMSDEPGRWVKGGEYEFLDSAYDFHSGVVRYWFKSVTTGNEEVLHLWIDQAEPNWRDLGKLQKIEKK